MVVYLPLPNLRSDRALKRSWEGLGQLGQLGHQSFKQTNRAAPGR